MNYTKGKWTVTGTSIFANDDYRQMVAQAFDPDKPLHTTPVAEANAHLIAAAVNACASVNTDNPMSVAESIKDMYEALKVVLPWAKEWIKYLRNNVGQGQGQNADEQFLMADKALAKVEGREE